MPLPPKLQAGDRVRLVSPAARPDRVALEYAANVIAGWGFTVEIGEHASERWRHLAGTDKQRLTDLNAAFRDPGVRAVITTRGDGGAYRIADQLDLDAASRDPKPIVGIDGITHLHLTLWRECRLPGLYGTLTDKPGTTEDTAGQSSLRRALMITEPITVHRQPDEVTAAVAVSGRATGVLVGGNLSAIRTMVGAGLPSLDGAIVLLSDKRIIGLGQVDRQLTHLLRSRSLDGVRGIVLGRFTGFDGFIDRGWTIAEVLQDRLSELGVPVLGGVPLGNGANALAAPLGTTATLDADTGTLTMEPAIR